MLDDLSFRPHIIKAIYNWCLEKHQTPYMVVSVGEDEIKNHILKRHIKDGNLILNISSEAVRDLVIGAEYVAFTARFDGKTVEMNFSLISVVALYALEGQKGIAFSPPAAEVEKKITNSKSLKTSAVPKKKTKTPTLKVL